MIGELVTLKGSFVKSIVPKDVCIFTFRSSNAVIGKPSLILVRLSFLSSVDPPASTYVKLPDTTGEYKLS